MNVEEGRRGCERARIWVRRKEVFRSIIVGSEEEDIFEI